MEIVRVDANEQLIGVLDCGFEASQVGIYQCSVMRQFSPPCMTALSDFVLNCGAEPCAFVDPSDQRCAAVGSLFEYFVTKYVVL